MEKKAFEIGETVIIAANDLVNFGKVTDVSFNGKHLNKYKIEAMYPESVKGMKFDVWELDIFKTDEIDKAKAKIKAEFDLKLKQLDGVCEILKTA